MCVQNHQKRGILLFVLLIAYDFHVWYNIFIISVRGMIRMKLIIIGIVVVLLIVAVVVIISKLGGNKTENKKLLKEIYSNFSQSAVANIIDICENEHRNPLSPHRYSVVVSFCYDGKRGRTPCMYTIYTDDSSVRSLEEQIPLVVIPPYLDYKRNVLTKKELFDIFGHTFDVNNKNAFPMAVYEQDAKALY